jgi:integrase/recombinase XerD
VLVYHQNVATNKLELIEGFAFRLRRQGCAPATVSKYSHAAEDYLAWYDGDPVAARRQDIEDYLDQWASTTGAKPSSVRLRIAALKKLYDYIDSRGLLVDESGRELRNPLDRVERPKSKRKANDYLTDDECAALLAACSNPQEAALLDLLRWSGLRIAEACALTWDSYDGEWLRVTTSKTDAGIRQVPVLPELEKGLSNWRRYLEANGLYSASGPVLVTRNGTPMRHQYAWRILKRVADRAGVRSREATDKSGYNVSEISPHTLRRTFATDLLNRGVRIEVVSAALGHSDTRTTQAHYAELQNKTARSEILAAYGA